MSGGGGGSSKVTEHNDLVPKTAEQIALENRMYGYTNRILNGAETGDYGQGNRTLNGSNGGTNGKGGPLTGDRLGARLAEADRQRTVATNNYNTLNSNMMSANNSQLAALNNASTAADPWYAKAGTNYDKAATAGDSWYANASDAFTRANGLIRDANTNNQQASDTNAWYDNYSRGQLGNAAELLKTGNVPQELEQRMLGTINRNLENSMGSALNDFASRGVINSSITDKGISDLSQHASNAYNDNYLNTFNSVLGGYQNNAQIAGQNGTAFADTFLKAGEQNNSAANTAINLGNAYSNTGKGITDNFLNIGKAYTDQGTQATQNQLGVAQGYGQAQTNSLAGMNQMMSDIPSYFANALTEIGIGNDFLKQMQEARSKDTVTTAIQQGGGGGGPCFITTAMCGYFGMPDDCMIMTTLREFREGWLRKQDFGPKVLEQYRISSATVVPWLNSLTEADQSKVFHVIRYGFIEPAVDMIMRDYPLAAYTIYKAMVEYLEGVSKQCPELL